MSEDLYALLRTRDHEISVLRNYIAALEEELREARGDSAHEHARQDATALITELRYEHGLKSDGRIR